MPHESECLKGEYAILKAKRAKVADVLFGFHNSANMVIGRAATSIASGAAVTTMLMNLDKQLRELLNQAMTEAERVKVREGL